MKIVYLFVTVGCVFCMPHPQGFFESLAAAFGGGIGAIEGLGQSFLNTFGSANANRSGGIVGELSGVAGTLAESWSNLNMPPKKDGAAAPKEGRKKARKKSNVKNKKDECPSRIRKTDRVVLNSQARDIIAKVYDFMKREATADCTQHLKNARWRAATATGVSEKTVSRILKDRNKKKGAAVAGTGAVVAGKANAAASIGLAASDFSTGNFTGAANAALNAVGSVAAGDLAGIGIAATGVANAAGQIAGAKLHAAGDVLSTVSRATGQVVGGKLGAVGALATGFRDISAGNITGFANDLGTAAGTLIGADVAALGTIANGTFGLFLGR